MGMPRVSWEAENHLFMRQHSESRQGLGAGNSRRVWRGSLAETSCQHQCSVSGAGLAYWKRGLAGGLVSSSRCSGDAETSKRPGKGQSPAEQLPELRGERKAESSLLQPQQPLCSAEKEAARVIRFLSDKYISDAFNGGEACVRG